jgi:hypothetical protein
MADRQGTPLDASPREPTMDLLDDGLGLAGGVEEDVALCGTDARRFGGR